MTSHDGTYSSFADDHDCADYVAGQDRICPQRHCQRVRVTWPDGRTSWERARNAVPLLLEHIRRLEEELEDATLSREVVDEFRVRMEGEG